MSSVFSHPAAVLKLLDLRDELRRRGAGSYLGSWTCPGNNPALCNPCGVNSGKDDSWGGLNGGGGWDHIACRRAAGSKKTVGPTTTTTTIAAANRASGRAVGGGDEKKEQSLQSICAVLLFRQDQPPTPLLLLPRSIIHPFTGRLT